MHSCGCALACVKCVKCVDVAEFSWRMETRSGTERWDGLDLGLGLRTKHVRMATAAVHTVTTTGWARNSGYLSFLLGSDERTRRLRKVHGGQCDDEQKGGHGRGWMGARAEERRIQ